MAASGRLPVAAEGPPRRHHLANLGDLDDLDEREGHEEGEDGLASVASGVCMPSGGGGSA